eukprot:CAMPEP_0183310154 /NCGR_PEP_ID=MMETSP0160_2-20130417/29497_1 /TAXON_ID=2839 ORGANISM="Odontella Sinensis, Strain Grunow 1884" /NCGR_SAMPLE_ID=MMETSP0160_2 /ASSEMBLY_ACC=CAM_ASM_000250 /LENGTH=145 /DNA_ID=CAMNT_0025474327 /DNA_START=165 /DNA_END=602 /DNA_ORIENTATION=+
MTILSKQSGEEYEKKNYSDRMKKTGRPVSPHVTIYAFPITALSSITNRVTGVALSFGAAGLGLVEVLGGNGAALALMQDIGSMGPAVSSVAKFSVAYPCVYHYLGGIRHMIWDKYPDLLTNAEVEKHSWALVGGSLVLTLPFMLF